ncbi:DegV family protein [Helicovermis profundi]|uniref:DegV family protein n=1 Tax=Helicovermis profundi TaxID=3065157 RepID=A0AAU9E8B7_9FIRM|nr:DegV family protein [Clostridia bacterium S502]
MKIVADSSCDLNKELQEKLDVSIVPLTIYLDEAEFKDDASLDVSSMLDKISNSKLSPRSACPSPKDFLNTYMGEESIFVVTMTSALSSTYNSALLAKELYFEEFKKKFIHIFDSKGSSVKETLIAIKIKELIDKKMCENDIVVEMNKYIGELKYFFQLGSLDTLIKNGRISKLKGTVASAMNIKPILYADENGEIVHYENVRTEKKSLKKFIDIISKYGTNISDKIIGISHCKAGEKAEKLKIMIKENYDFKDIIIVETKGLSSMYVNKGGITISF